MDGTGSRYLNMGTFLTVINPCVPQPDECDVPGRIL